MFFARAASGGIPRGLARSGPALLTYGFRPFFLLAGIWAVAAMVLWVLALTTGIPIGGEIGSVHWHAHEMVFGYTSAALAGFVLTAVPNWTGRLPVSGKPLVVLVAVWLLGRIAMLAPAGAGLAPALVVEALFLPLLTVVVMREIIAGKNWKNLKILVALCTLSAANIWFQTIVASGRDPTIAMHLAVAAWAVLIALVGGRIIPSFTRNWLAKRKASGFPAPYGRFDQAAIGLTVLALGTWIVSPDSAITAALCFVAALANLVRLARWRGWACVREPIVIVLHIAYLFLALGLAGVGASALGVFAPADALHIILVGAIGGMTLAVMTRASLGHTGRPIRAGILAILAYLDVFAAALIRPMAALFPEHYFILITASGLLWILAFTMFTAAYAPILLAPRLARK